jgi:hypothetical protein
MGGIGRVITAVVMFLTTVAGTSGGAAVILDSLVVRVYDNAGVLARDRARAVQRAHEILAGADLAIEWRDCPARGGWTRASCSNAPHAGDLAVRLVRSPKGDPNPRPLGNALIDPATGTGTLATVFVDRVEAISDQGKADAWSMVGRVMAHEIGHLLLRTNAHTDTGLMREIGTLKDLIRNRPEDWLFSSRQRQDLRSWRLRG